MKTATMIKIISDRSGVAEEDVRLVLETFTAFTEEYVMRGERVRLHGFGAFHLKKLRGFKTVPVNPAADPVPERERLSFYLFPTAKARLTRAIEEETDDEDNEFHRDP